MTKGQRKRHKLANAIRAPWTADKQDKVTAAMLRLPTNAIQEMMHVPQEEVDHLRQVIAQHTKASSVSPAQVRVAAHPVP